MKVVIKLLLLAMAVSFLLGSYTSGSAAEPNATIEPDATPVATPTITAPDPAVKWKVDAGNIRFSSLATANGLVYVPGDGSLTALDLRSGQKRWEFESGLYGYEGTDPVVAGDTVLFGISSDISIDPSRSDYLYAGVMFALDARTGREKWRFKVDEEQVSTPVVVNDTIYFGSGHLPDGTAFSPPPNGYIYALKLATGKLQWRLPIPGEDVLVTPAFKKDTLYFIAGDYYTTTYLHSLDLRTRKENWKLKLADRIDDNMTSFAPVVVGDLVYVAGLYRLYAVDAKTGTLKWNFDTVPDSSPLVTDIHCCGNSPSTMYNGKLGAWPEISASAVFTSIYVPQPQVQSPPLVDNGIAYFGVNLDSGVPDERGYFNRIDFYMLGLDASTGQERWRFRSPEEIGSIPVIDAGIIYFDASYINYYLYAVDMKSKQVKWRLETETFTVTPPVVVDGVLYVGDYNDNVYAVLTSPVGMPTAGGLNRYIVVAVLLATFILCLGATLRRSRSF